MPDYRRAFAPGGTFFFTLCTHERRRLFSDQQNIEILRDVVRRVKGEWAFDVVGAVVLPDHLHWIWSLPEGDPNFSRRIGRVKALFTKGFGELSARPANRSRDRHRESEVWQRRFWEHAIKDESDLENH